MDGTKHPVFFLSMDGTKHPVFFPSMDGTKHPVFSPSMDGTKTSSVFKMIKILVLVPVLENQSHFRLKMGFV
jgi:hypothetical protein